MSRKNGRAYGQLTRKAGPLANVKAGDLLPNGAKVVGVNLLGSTAQEKAAASTVIRWAKMWADWDAANIQRQLDNALMAGCNTVRIQGTVYGIYNSLLTRSQYLARWAELSGYCQQRGLFLYGCGADGGSNDGGFNAVPWTNTLNELVAWATQMNTLPDVIGLDLVQESPTFRDSANGLTLYQQVKAVTALPCTYSGWRWAEATNPLTPTAASDRQDFFDYHVYASTTTTQSLTDYWAAGGTRPVLIGEFSHDVGVAPTQAGWVARYQEVRAMLRHVGPQSQRMAGALTWATQDTYTDAPGGWGGTYGNPNDNYGIFDLNGNERTYLTDLLRMFPKN